MSITEVIRSMPDYIGGNGRSEEAVQTCEQQLGLSFAEDYKEYLLQIGLACFDGRELTGICKATRLNVVDMTVSARERYGTIPADFYVIEEVGIDGIIVWQASDGTVYETIPGRPPREISKSLIEYLREA